MDENKEIENVEQQVAKEEMKTENEPKEETKIEVKQDKKVQAEPIISAKSRKGYCIASLVLGIISLVFNCCFWYIAIPCAILAVIFGILGIKAKEKDMAIAGLITGAITIAMMILIMVFLVSFAIYGEAQKTIRGSYEDFRCENSINCRIYENY